MQLEACVETLAQCRHAYAHGAHRLELCNRLDLGGTTPDFVFLKKIQSEIPLPIMVMIRPRGGNFVYSEAELQQMEEEIAQCKQAGVLGVVFGILNIDNTIDIKTTKRLTKAADGLQITFHKAIDDTPDIFAALEQLKGIGIHRILTSGTKATAWEGKEILAKMVQQAGQELKIIAAGKVTQSNLTELHKAINAPEYHGKKIV